MLWNREKKSLGVQNYCIAWLFIGYNCYMAWLFEQRMLSASKGADKRRLGGKQMAQILER
eukprot:1136869-Pelagomonas_calceolata.AAC.4